MSPELEKILVEKYPTLLREYGGDPMQTCMAFGIETNGDGWFKIIDDLFGYLTNLMNTPLHIPYTDEYKEKHKGEKDYYDKHYSYKYMPPKIVLAQVKEKWGTLTVYHNCMDDQDIPDDIWVNLNLEEFYKKLNRYNDKIDFAIDYASYLSSITCEITGKPGKHYTKGWHQTLCDEEAVKRGYKPEEGSEEGIKVEEL